MLAGAQEEMKSATDFLSRKNAQAGSTRQRDAMGEINKATAKLMESLDQQKQCNNPSNNSCSNGMPQLDALSKKQQKLNEETKGMCQNPGGKMGKNGTPQNGNSEATQRMKEGLKRLAGEQGQIRKQMEELQKEFGNSRQLLGRLDDIAREMGKVEEDLSDGEPGSETSDRQLKILSRMLEATRSLQRRDFNPDRQASTATTNPVYLPPDLAGELGDDQRFEDRLKQFLGEGYPQQYEAQIKAYFRALLEAERSRQSTGSAQ
jgi:DNA repair exonuclease SbcCD ATPase subunit